MAICDAYVILDKKEIIHANPHSARGVATPWATFAMVPAQEICQAAT